MRVPHLHPTLLELVPDGAVIDAEVLADTCERLASSVQLFRLIDLLGREAALTELDALALQDGGDGRWVNLEAPGELEGLATGLVLVTEVSSLFAA